MDDDNCASDPPLFHRASGLRTAVTLRACGRGGASSAAGPYNTKEKASCFRIDYLKYGFMPIRIIVTNDGDKPINLEQARIHFITASGDKIPAAEAEDVERRTTDVKSVTGPKIAVPGLPKPKSKNSKVDEDFEE